MFKKLSRRRNQDGTFKKDVGWTPWNEAWRYTLSKELKDMLEKTVWTFVEAFFHNFWKYVSLSLYLTYAKETLNLIAFCSFCFRSLPAGDSALAQPAVLKAYAARHTPRGWWIYRPRPGNEGLLDTIGQDFDAGWELGPMTSDLG